MVRLRYTITVVYVYVPIGIILGFFLALGIIVAMGTAAKRADLEREREILKGMYRKSSEWKPR